MPVWARSYLVRERAVRKLADAISVCRTDIVATLGEVADGWSVAPYEPLRVFACFPRLRLRKGVQLAAYHFRVRGHNNGVVFVIPEGRELPPSLDIEWESVPGPSEPLKPEGIPVWADRQLGPYLEGDGSPSSFFQASLLQRELAEIGATWRGRDWQMHTLLTGDPFPVAADGRTGLGFRQDPDWRWVEPVPRNWRPLLCIREGAPPMAQFYTHSPLHRERIIRHRDTFRDGYAFETTQQTVGQGSRGLIF